MNMEIILVKPQRRFAFFAVLLSLCFLLSIGIISLILYSLGYFSGGDDDVNCSDALYWADIHQNQIQYHNNLTLRYVS